MNSILQIALTAHQAGNLHKAAQHYQQALQEQPNNHQALHLYGTLLHQLGRTNDAIATLQKALSINNAFPDTWFNLATIFKQTGAINQALQCYQNGFNLEPGNSKQGFNFALLLMQVGNQTAARDVCIQLLKTNPNFAEALGLLADIYINFQQLDEADDCLTKALVINAKHPELLYSKGFVLEAKHDIKTAIDFYTDCLEQQPNHGAALSALLFAKRRIASWNNINQLQSKLISAVENHQTDITPFSFLAETDNQQQHLQCARTWAKSIKSRVPKIPAQQFNKANKKQLTIGYLSADFYQHPTAYLTAGLFEHHDKQQFKIIAYSNSRYDQSAIRTRIETAFDQFRDIRKLSPLQVAEQIVNDGVDILVDLKGYTLEACTDIMALKAAPIQVNYLGYPGTMGADFIDYIIGDPIVTPQADQQYYSESIAHIPCYQINDSKRPRPDKQSKPSDFGLPETNQGFVFCCFNNTWKFNAELFNAYLEILKGTPNSVLWLLAKESSNELIANLKAFAQDSGVAPERLIFANKKPLEHYLEYFHHAHLFLDSFPYNAHTTASDALWMGTPVLTLQGKSFASRVASSLISTALPKHSTLLISDSTEQFISKAISIATHAETYATIKTACAGAASSDLFNTEKTTRHIEQAYNVMYQQWLNNQPASFINIDD